MRIDVDQDLEKELDKIKQQRWISGKGHTETVRYLVNHYKQYGSIENLVEQKLSEIQGIIESSILGAFRKILNNLLGGK